MDSAIHEVTDENIDDVVADSNLVLLVFGLPGCGPCRDLGLVLPQIALRYLGRLSVITVDALRCPKVCQVYNVNIFPTSILLYCSKEVGIIRGFAGCSFYSRKLEELVGDSKNLP
ncbi:thioredoxin family protein [Streptomyces gamaensis]|uniref:Thioredoxin family protein n=1 Tax=Streptomyces gamaensis TaxID=1763542 RepID=A0ABW0Z659_9ACTN